MPQQDHHQEHLTETPSTMMGAYMWHDLKQADNLQIDMPLLFQVSDQRV